MPGNPWIVNVFVLEGVHFYECYPTSHVRCRYCRRRIKRRKIDSHIRDEHAEML